jgi:hypothetical protein
MIASCLRILLLSPLSLNAGQLSGRGAFASANEFPRLLGAPEERPLPKEVMGFHGKVTGTVVSVDGAKAVMTVKVVKAEAHPMNNRAPKPEALNGMTIIITPLEVKPKTGPAVPDAKVAAYIAGTLAGDSVSLDVRTSSKGVLFRLLKVPAAGKK